MATSKVEELYQQHIKLLSPVERLRLLELIAYDLVAQPIKPAEKPKRSIMELHGLGKEIWAGVDAQEYTYNQRRDWDRHL